MAAIHNQNDGTPPFVASKRLRNLFATPGYLRGKKGEEARELHQNEAMNFNPLRDLSPFGKLCFLGNIKGVKERYERDKVDLNGTETPYQWGYVSLTACGSRVTQYKGPGMYEFKSGVAPHASVIEFLISQGAPADLPDIGGLTALHHVAMNNVVTSVIKALVSGGADPNARDRYGQTPVTGALMSNQVEAVDLCMKYGAELDIPDGDGVLPTSLMKYASPEMHSVVEKHLRKREGINAPMEDKSKCAACGSASSKSQCSRCRVVRYCGPQCQAAHWKAGHKTVCVPFNDNQNTIVVKPTYNDFSGLVSMKEVVNSYRFDATGQPDGEGSRAAQGQNGRGKSKPKVSKPKEGKAMIIKAQVPMILDPQKGMVSDSKHVVENSKTGDFGTFSGILIYNRTRDFQCCIRRDGQREVYDVLDRVIRAKGSMGLKGYFTAELESEDRLKIKVKDMLAEQPW